MSRSTLPLPHPSGDGAAPEWAATQVDPDGGKRRRFGRYVDVRELARGGMGAVLQAIDPELDRPVAIKVMLEAVEADAALRARFLREARITGQLQHPNIPPLHELARTPEGRIYFAMKLIEGKSLARLIEEGAPRRELLASLVKVCDALAYAHSRGIVHRDLKPANVMVGAFGEVLVMDWGIAKVVGAPDESRSGRGDFDPSRTADGMVLGTPAYMSPEQAAGRVEAIDARSDVYSLGAMVHEVLTGRPPFEDRSFDRMLVRIKKGDRVPPSRRAPDARIEPELDRLVEKAMHVDPAGRYAGAQEVGRELEAYLAGRPLAACRYTAWRRAAMWVRRNRAISIVSAAAALTLSVLVVWLAVALAGSEALREQAEEERARATRAVEEILALSEVTQVSNLLGRERIGAYQGYPDRTTGLEAWLARARRFEGRRAHHAERIREIESVAEPGEALLWELEHRGALVERLDELERASSETRQAIDRARELQALAGTPRHVASWTDAEQDGVEIPRCAALVPIGRDLGSGFSEFWHVASGERPGRDMDGRLVLGPRTGIVLVLLPGGRYRMGSDDSRSADEKPAHDVDVPAFLISKYELTLGQWQRLREHAAEGPLLPAERISWTDCQVALPRWGLRLPSEAEWEYAARAGTTGEWWTEDLATAGNLADRRATEMGAVGGEPWDDGAGPPCPVGRYRANPFGLHDTIGNVWEWCEDGYRESYSGAPHDGSAWGGGEDALRVFRGGSCGTPAQQGRSAERYGTDSLYRTVTVGVRPAMTIPGR